MRRFFTIRYITLKQYFAVAIMIPYTGILIALSMAGFSYIFEDCTNFIPFLIISLLLLNCISYSIKKFVFKIFGKKYAGKIVKAEMVIGRGENTYFLFIEFYKNKKKLIRRTSGYMGNPNRYLKNTECNVYEFLGSFIENDFNVRKKFPCTENEFLNIQIESVPFLPKKNK